MRRSAVQFDIKDYQDLRQDQQMDNALLKYVPSYDGQKKVRKSYFTFNRLD